jgi:hypothetical protein
MGRPSRPRLRGGRTDPRPLRAFRFGGQFVSIDDGPMGGMCASGPGCMAMLGQRLLAAGVDANQKLAVYRGGVFIGSVRVGELTSGVCDSNE